MPPIIPRIVAFFAAKSAGRELNQFFHATEHLQAVQQSVLRRQLKLVAQSDFTRDYHLDAVDGVKDFRNRLPVMRYENIKPYIERLKQGDTRALFAPGQNLLLFALTSGTTAEPKFIPVTRQSLADYRRGWNIFGLKALLDHPNAFFRKIVQITSPARETQTPGGAWAGAITGLLAETQKWIVRRHYVTPLSAAQIKDPTAKMYVVAYRAIGEDVAFINTANPSTTLRLAQTIDRFTSELIRDLRDGVIRPPGNADHSEWQNLAQTPNPKRAAKLEALRSRHGRLLPRNLWNLSFIDNWTGGTLKLYLQRFPEYFGDTPVRDLGLLASEGRFSIPIQDHTPAGILDITSNFFEFIPESEYEQTNPTVLTADQVKVGERYFLVFSNATGLCRYDIGDLVRVVDFYRQTPMIEFLNKGAHVSSVTGEKVTEHQVVEAMEQVARQLGQTIDSFLLQPQWADPPHYVLSVEIGAGPTEILADLFDRALAQINLEYKLKRESGRLGPVQMHVLPKGFFRDDDLRRLAAGGRSEQYKRKFLQTDFVSSA